MEDDAAVPAARARELAGVSMRRLRYWDEVGLVVPEARQRPGRRGTARLYGPDELHSLLVVSELRARRHVPLQRIRAMVEELRERGYGAPLSEVRLATMGHDVYFQHEDGSWEGHRQPGQTVLIPGLLGAAAGEPGPGRSGTVAGAR
jgi:DNA-binding transcriptional MerR regulator